MAMAHNICRRSGGGRNKRFGSRVGIGNMMRLLAVEAWSAALLLIDHHNAGGEFGSAFQPGDWFGPCPASGIPWPGSARRVFRGSSSRKRLRGDWARPVCLAACSSRHLRALRNSRARRSRGNRLAQPALGRDPDHSVAILGAHGCATDPCRVACNTPAAGVARAHV